VKLKTDTLIGFIVCHLLALLALLPMFFSWTGVVVAAAGILAFGVLGINVGFHRLLTHRSFSCPLWLEHVFAVLGTCSAQFSPAFWVAIHRRHHHFSDDEMDPHSPLRSFFWAHCGWLLVRPDDMKPAVMIDRYARDVMRDPLYATLERRKNWMKLAVLAWLAFFVAGFAAALAIGDSLSDAFWFLWGYRNYATNDDSRNNAIVGIFAAGEGWHNNHHADPGSARHGHKWWEFDFTWQVIRLLALLGLATKVVLPAPGRALVESGRPD
jgi:stearoyl-CoA desaturase (delta-9 desaturase)